MWEGVAENGDCRIGVDIYAGNYNLAADYGLEPHTFMQRGRGVAKQFGDAMPNSAKVALHKWKQCYGKEQSEWPFNTKCCAKEKTKAGLPPAGGDRICVAPTVVTV